MAVRQWQAIASRCLQGRHHTRTATVAGNIVRPNQQPNGNGSDGYARSFATVPQADGSWRGEAYAAAALQGAVAEVGAAPNGKRNETLNAVAFRLGRMIGRGWIDEKTVADALLGPAMQTSICVSMAIASRRKPSRAGLKPAGNSRTRTCRTAVPHQPVTAQPTFLTFLTFPPPNMGRSAENQRRAASAGPEGGDRHMGGARLGAAR